MARYNISAIPVVDKGNRLVGIITVDDVIDIIQEEATEDIMKLVGTSEQELAKISSFKSFLMRIPWLLISFFGGMMTIQTNVFFLEKMPAIELMAFITIIAGMGGNIGTQSSTVVVRGLATGSILSSDLPKMLLREISTGLMLGAFFGVLLGTAASLRFEHTLNLTLSVCGGMIVSMFIASLIGTLMPMIFHRINVDPAIATGPFVSTAIDNIGLLGYFLCSILIFSYLA